MKVLALLLVISLASIVCSNTRQLMVVDDNYNMHTAYTQQVEAQGDEKSVNDMINNHHNIPRDDWGNDGGDIKDQN